MSIDLDATTFPETLGLRKLPCADGEALIQLKLHPALCNEFGAAHGGIVMTLLDVAMAVAARTQVPGYGVVTVDFSTSFMRPAKGATLLGRGLVMQSTATTVFCRGTVEDEQGRVMAMAQGTFRKAPSALRQRGVTPGSAAPA